jgi:tRNA modification GTPase
MNDTIVALATPPGRGAIAMIRLSGKDAFMLGDKVFGTSKKQTLVNSPSHTVHLGFISDKNHIVVDQVLATVFKQPKSFTGENTVEFSCHGSPYIQQRILQLLVDHGARFALPGEFSLRAFLNGKMDLSQAEAVGDLIAADSSAAHTVALQQMRGGFSKQIKELRQQLIDFASLLELELDFSEEDVEFAKRDELKNLLTGLSQKLRSMSDSFASGNVIKNGIPVAITGKPNAGKSTLINAILNEERALVSEIAGTTRDTIEEEITINGVSFRFIDTAGMRATTDVIEAMGVSRTRDKIQEASVILYLFDPAETGADELKGILEKIHQGKTNTAYTLMPIANKSDRFEEHVLKRLYADYPDMLFISARNKTGLDVLYARLGEIVNDNLVNLNDSLVTNARHKAALDKTLEALTFASA